MKWSEALFVAILAVAGGVLAYGQTAQPTQRTQITGTVTSVNPQGGEVSLKSDKGDVTVATNDRTQLLHAQPGENDPKKWAKIAVSDVAPGDQVLVIIRGTLEQKPLVASSLVVRTKSDLATMAQHQLDDWKKRGTTGTVTSIDAGAKTITIKVGQKTVVVQPTDKTEYHRYSLDSAKVTDATPSSFSEIKMGDQLNVLGNKSDDGSSVKAEVVYAGTFRQIAATIVSVDSATGEMKVTDLATKKPLVIRINSDSVLKKLPDQMAQGLARRYGAARGGASANGGPPRGGGPGGPGGGTRGGGDVAQMLDRLPAMPVSDLKPKDAIMVSTTQGSDPTRVTAIMLLAGVEPILTAAPEATRDIMGTWNLGGGGGEGN